MTTIEEIESAIERLPAVELTRLKTWISQRDNAEWDRQMDSDSKEGRLDFLFTEAQEDRIRGKLHDWPVGWKLMLYHVPPGISVVGAENLGLRKSGSAER